MTFAPLHPTAAALRRRLAEVERNAAQLRELVAQAEERERRASFTLPLREARALFEREYLGHRLAECGGNVSRTAEAVGMDRAALSRKLVHLGIHKEPA